MVAEAVIATVAGATNEAPAAGDVSPTVGAEGAVTVMASGLDEFSALRRANLSRMRALKLDASKLDLRGRHPDLGLVTVRQLLSTWVVHDLGHLAQIARVMSKRYSAEVGPWIAYLPILTRGAAH